MKCGVGIHRHTLSTSGSKEVELSTCAGDVIQGEHMMTVNLSKAAVVEMAYILYVLINQNKDFHARFLGAFKNTKKAKANSLRPV